MLNVKAKPAKAAKAAAAPVTEAAAPEAPAAAPFDKAAARAIASAAFARFDAASVSVPIKPLAAFKAYRATLGALRCREASKRQAAALTVALLASGQRFATSDDAAPVTFPRRFTLTGGAYAVENGCAADAVSVNLCDYDDAAEAFTVTPKQARAIAALIGQATAPEAFA